MSVPTFVEVGRCGSDVELPCSSTDRSTLNGDDDFGVGSGEHSVTTITDHTAVYWQSETTVVNSTLLSLLLLASPGQFLEDMVDDVIDERYETVAVLPRPIFVDGKDQKQSLGGELGPQADYFCDRLSREIVKLADGEFEVVETSKMQEICRKYSLTEIQRKSVRQLIAEQADDAEVLVIPVVTNSTSPARKFDLKCILVDLDRNSEEEYGVEELQIGLSDAAYMGESWELRRWNADGSKLLNVGLEDSGASPKSALFGTGPRMEQRQYKWIDRSRPHPLVDGTKFPASVEVVVNGNTRPLIAAAPNQYVELESGEEPVIKVANNGAKDIYALVFVDGINVMGKKREHPGEVIGKDRHRLLKRGQGFDFEGWYTPKAGNTWSVESFKLTDERSSVAAEQGSTDRVGMITVLFYTVGWEGVVPGDRFLQSGGRLGFGSGRTRPVELDASNADAPGLLLSAVTIRYGRKSEVDALSAVK